MLGTFLLTGCAQFTTDDQELAQLDRAARAKADAYVSCVTTEAGKILANSTDEALIVNTARDNCAVALEDYEDARSEFLDEQYMLFGKKLEGSVQRVDERARNEATLVVLSRQQQGQSAAAVIKPTDPAAWNPDQRVYLDCMEDQARKLIRVNENPETVVKIAYDSCRRYMGSPNIALENEGRTVVLSTIFDMQANTAR
jgi:hypothetical protein